MHDVLGDFGNKIEIFEKNGLEPLIRLLASTDCDIQVTSGRKYNVKLYLIASETNRKQCSTSTYA
jgi:hypothetical protein